MKSTILCSVILIIFNIFSSSGQGLSEKKQISQATVNDIPIGQLDPEMSYLEGVVDLTGLWVNAKELTIEGMGWSGNGIIDDYTRLPQIHKDSVSVNVWELSRYSAGIHVRCIVTGTKEIKARWTLRGNENLTHMTLQAVNGVDLYIKSSGKWVFAGTGRPGSSGLEHEYVINSNLNASEKYECMLYLPLYNGVSSVQLGFDKEANVSPAPSLPEKPMVFYGSSILQGCSASRSGMSFPSMLGRKYNVPVVNLGFSENGFTEPYFGKVMSDVDASIYFIDCLPDMGSFSTDEITNRTLALVRNIRAKHSQIPIVLVEGRTLSQFTSEPVVVKTERIGLRAAYDILKQETENLYYVEGENLLRNNNEATVDGSHPSDLGMYYYFQQLDSVVAMMNIYKLEEEEEEKIPNQYASSETQRLQDDITAGTYDEYILTTSGGQYVLTTTGLSPVRPSKSFVLKAADGLSTRPILSFSSKTSSTTRYMFYPTDTVTAVFEGLEIDGFNPQKTVGTGKDGEGEPNFFRTYTGHETSRIIIRDCYLHGFSNLSGLFRIDGAGTSLLIEESTFKQCDVNIVNFNTANLAYGDLTIRNSTFSEVSGASSAVSYASGSSATSIDIDHCTMHNFTTTRDIFAFKSVSGSVQIRNSLFYGINGGFDFSNPVPVIDNCYLAGFATAPTGNISNSFSGTLPLFANVEGLHYGLTNQSHFVCNDGLSVGNTMYYLEKPVTQAEENITNEGFTISWQAVPRAKAYQVMLYQGSTLIETDEVGSNLLYYTFTELTEGASYSYRVMALHKGFGFDSEVSELKEVQTLSTTGIKEVQEVKQVWVVGDEIHLRDVGSLKVYNLQGVLVYQGQHSTIYKTGLSRGIYIVSFALNQGERYVRRIYVKSS